MKKAYGFTIIELLVVIVIIGILAAITVVSYTGIAERAKIVSIKADLNSASKLLSIYNVENGYYPATVSSDCTASPTNATNLCIKTSAGSDFTSVPYIRTSEQSYVLTETNGNLTYDISEKTAPKPVVNVVADTWGGASDEFVGYAVKTSDNGYILAGSTSSYGTGGDVIISKYNKFGHLSWSRTWGGSLYDMAFSIIQTNDGGYAVTGRTDSYAVASNGSDSFLLKYDSTGNLIWNKTWGGNGVDVGKAVIQTSDNGYLVVGDAVFGTNGSVFIAKYDTDGNLLWNKIWDGNNGDHPTAAIQTSDGGYAVTGYSYSFGAGNGDLFLIKYDNLGNVSWNKTYGGAQSDGSLGLIQTSDSGYALVGYTNSYGGVALDNVIFVKCDSGGTPTMTRTWGGTGSDIGNSIIRTSDSGYAIAGYQGSFGAGGNDAFIIKYDSGGALSWSKTFGGTGSDFGYNIFQEASGGYAMIGYSASYGAGGFDTFIVKADSSGAVAGCSSPMCQSPTPTTASPSPTVGTPAASVSSPAATVTTPSATVSSPNLTTSIVIAP